jgi:hypothetical protein
MKRSIFYFLLLFSMLSDSVFSQELRCNVQIISSQIQGTNRQIFKTLQEEIYNFMNNTTWSDDQFASQERIECNILINLQEHTGSQFKGSMTVSSRRPVYSSSYNTPILLYKDDDIQFRYQENEPLEFDINDFKSNLTSLLAYYAYMIIGLDYDSFEVEGGTPYFQKAQQIVSNAQNSQSQGWKAYESRRNRYWLVENILNNEYEKVRKFFYQYHRLGLDEMHDNVSRARADISESLVLLLEVHREKPDPYMFYMKLVIESKSNEFVNLFSESPVDESERVYKILAEIDPSHSKKYEKITQ